MPPIVRYEAEPVSVIEPEAIGKHPVQIRKEDGIFFVEGEWLLRIMRTVNFNDYESMQYFQRVLIAGGVIDALREAGCTEGDTVSAL